MLFYCLKALRRISMISPNWQHKYGIVSQNISDTSCSFYIKSYIIVSFILVVIVSDGNDGQQTHLHSCASNYSVTHLINKLSSECPSKKSVIESKNQYHKSGQDDNWQNLFGFCETMYVPQTDDILQSEFFNQT